MIKKPKLDAVPAKDLQRVFETAVGEIERAQSSRERLGYRTPIFHRGDKSVPSPAKSEKRAVSDAAYALAQLWKISPHHAR